MQCRFNAGGTRFARHSGGSDHSGSSDVPRLAVQHQSPGATSQLIITFDSTAVLTPELLQHLAGRSALTRQIPDTTQPPGGSSWYRLSCAARPQAASDTDGTMTLQNTCPYAVANWSYRLSTYLQSLTISLVAESGMSWQRNSAAMSENASHLVSVGYWSTARSTRFENLTMSPAVSPSPSGWISAGTQARRR